MITYSADLSFSGIRYQMVHKGHLGPASCTYIFLWMQIWKLSLFCVHLNRWFKITPRMERLQGLWCSNTIGQRSLEQSPKTRSLFIFTYKYLFIEKTIKAQTNLSQMWLSHWSLGLWVGDDDSDPRQDLLKERDADRAKTKNSFFEKVNKR